MSTRIARLLAVLAMGLGLVVTPALLPAAVSAQGAEDRTISLEVFQCPPGVEVQEMVAADCTPLSSGVDVTITAINGSIPPFSIADAALDGSVYRWTTSSSGTATDEWGLKQTDLPDGTSAFLVQGATVVPAQSASFDYRFTTTDTAPSAELTMYVLMSEAPDAEPTETVEATEEATDTTTTDETTEPAETTETTDTTETTATTESEDESVAPADVGDVFLPGDQVMTFDGGLNLRSAPGTSSSIIQELPDGTLLTVLAGPSVATGYNWYQVETASAVTGWVVVDFITLVESPVPGDLNPGDRAIVFDGPLNLRSGAGVANSVLAVLPQDATMIILSGPVANGGYNWYEVDPDDVDVNGWVAGDFIAELGFLVGDQVFVNTDALNVRSAPGTSSTVLDVIFTNTVGTITAGPESASGLTWYELDVPGVVQGWVAGQYLALSDNPPVPPPSDQIDPGDWIFVNDPPLNFRSGAGTSASIIKVLGDGDGMIVLSGPTSADGYTWHQVEDAAETGWVAIEFVVGGFTTGQPARVADGPLNLRSAAGTSATILETLPQEEIVSVLAVEPQVVNDIYWFQVTTDTAVTGWVAGRYLGQAPAAG